MSRRSAAVRHDATADDHQRELVKLMRLFSNRHHLYSVFSDFVEICALSISNGVDRPQFDRREQRYLEIVGKYEKDELERFAQMFALLVMSFESRVEFLRSGAGGGLTDVLGETYMMLELGNARAGQFFTPYSISSLMARMTIGDGGDAVKECGFIRIQEPACGAGGMVIAAAESLNEAGLNYQQAMHATCIDIDPCCVHMAYVQFSLLHIPAIVVHGNALSMQVWGVWHTPAHIMGGWRWKLRARLEAVKAVDAEQDFDGGQTGSIATSLSPDKTVAEALAVADGGDGGAVLAAAEIGTSVMDLFEEAVDASPRSQMFDVIDQLTLF